MIVVAAAPLVWTLKLVWQFWRWRLGPWRFRWEATGWEKRFGVGRPGEELLLEAWCVGPVELHQWHPQKSGDERAEEEEG